MTRETFDRRWAGRLGPARWRREEPLAPLTTFRVGGPAEWLADIETMEELAALAGDAAEAGVPLTALGGGSNVLVADAGVRGVVFRPHLTSIESPAPGIVRAGAGVTINGLVRWTIGRGLAGIEAWAGTPGTVGGAIYGNAHWSGQNIGDLVVRVALVGRTGQVDVVPGSAMGFGYDTSRLQTSGEIAAWAEFQVTSGESVALRERARASLHYRKDTQPLALPSAGCVFQNPGPGDGVPAGIPLSAGALVDRAGLKGHRIGGASISTRHGNFIVNDGAASARDIRALIEHARQAVRRAHGVDLRDEIVYLGTF